MSRAGHHADWLGMLDVSGPFLALPILERVFPQGLPDLDGDTVDDLRSGWETWSESASEPGRDPDLHEIWVDWVLFTALGYEDDVLLSGARVPAALSVTLAEHSLELRPDRVLVDPGAGNGVPRPRLLVSVCPSWQQLDGASAGDGWSASPEDRMATLCRSTGVRLGLVTNGERWTLVDAPADGTTGFASWYARLWFEERPTLQAFVALLGMQRFFAAAETETLEALLAESVEFREKLTDQLGLQVRKAVEVLVQAFDKADLESKRQLLREVNAAQLYEAAVTVMMRLVFLLCAEERDLLLVGDPIWQEHYAVSGLRARLRAEADEHGLEILERRQDAWTRLLATSRAVHGGLEHDVLRLRPYGGSLFDPDRFPFLEGRAPGTIWRDTDARPLPVDNRTVLHLLEALQLLRVGGRSGTETRKLSFRELDVESIGYVYEGLLDHLATKAVDPALGLVGTSGKEPETSLPALEEARRRGEEHLLGFLREETGRSASALLNDLTREPDEDRLRRLHVACGHDPALVERIRPFLALVRDNPWGYPAVWRADSWMVTGGSERRETGTHYTPKPLTEAIVRETLEPIVYRGPAEGVPRDEWRLRAPAELLALKVCDPAMGSGAFLVQVCRYLGDRLVESWREAENRGEVISYDGLPVDPSATVHLLPRDPDERLGLARRLVAGRCLHGVDVNPMAVEMAKLSIWLFTLSRDLPFGFLDHAFHSGDSLLGVHDLDQLRTYHPDPTRGRVIHEDLLLGRWIEPAVERARSRREELEALRVLDIEDVHRQEALHREAEAALDDLRLAADVLMGATLATARGHHSTREDLVGNLSARVRDLLDPSTASPAVRRSMRKEAQRLLDTDLPSGKRPRGPFHWALEFPEVFQRENPGFDAIVGNPPFMGGQKITGSLGTAFREYLVTGIAGGARGSADLVAYFYLRAFQLLRQDGDFGLLAVNTIAEGDTRQVGLERLLHLGATVYSAWPNEPWPNQAAVVTSRVQVRKGEWKPERNLGGGPAPYISAFLSDREEWTPERLKANEGIAFQGSIILGMGFVLAEEEALDWIDRDPRYRDVLFPYLNGEDLNSRPEQKPSRWVINFWDWPEERARDYPLAFERVERLVKPERECNTYSRRAKDYWWLFERARPELYHAIGRGHHFERHPEGWDCMSPLDRVLVRALNSKHHTFAFVPATFLLDQTLNVFALESSAEYALLSSEIHCAWFYARGSSLGASRYPRYIQSDVFASFPHPNHWEPNHPQFTRLGDELLAARRTAMSELAVSLTGLLNAIHNPRSSMAEAQQLRELQVRLDESLCELYGWSDLDLGHDFHEVSYLPDTDNVRFTVEGDARRKILSYLADLNRERHEEEVRRGSHGKTTREELGARRHVVNRPDPPDVPRRPQVTQPSLYADGAVQEELYVELRGERQSSSPAQPRECGPLPSALPERPSLALAAAERAVGASTTGTGSSATLDDRVLAWLESNPQWHQSGRIASNLQEDQSVVQRTLDGLLARSRIKFRTSGLGRGEYRRG